MNRGSLRAARSVPTCAVAMAAACLLAGCQPPAETPAERRERRGAEEWIAATEIVGRFADPENGCQYLNTYQGGLTPRMGADGRQIGCKASPTAGGYEAEGEVNQTPTDEKTGGEG